jgi:hypothetical protein
MDDTSLGEYFSVMNDSSLGMAIGGGGGGGGNVVDYCHEGMGRYTMEIKIACNYAYMLTFM